MTDLPEGIEHGTPEGWAAGCRKDTKCPAIHTHGMACSYAKVRSLTDMRYHAAAARDPRPASIAHALGIHAAAARDDIHQDELREQREHTYQPDPTRQETIMTTRPDTPTPHESPAPTDTSPGFEKYTPITTEKWTTGLSHAKKTAKLAEIRDWCRAHGHHAPSKGKIPQAALHAYDDAHPGDPAPPDPITPDEHAELTTAATDTAAPLGIIPALLRREAEASSKLDGETFVVDDAPEDAGEWTMTIDNVDDEEPLTGNDFTDVLDETLARLAAPDPTTEANATRPEWADVTIHEDIERARNLATRLEQELAHETERFTQLLAQAHTALDVALHSWNTERTAHRTLDRKYSTARHELGAQRREIELLDNALADALAQATRWEKEAAEAREDADTARRELDEQSFELRRLRGLIEAEGTRTPRRRRLLRRAS